MVIILFTLIAFSVGVFFGLFLGDKKRKTKLMRGSRLYFSNDGISWAKKTYIKRVDDYFYVHNPEVKIGKALTMYRFCFEYQNNIIKEIPYGWTNPYLEEEL